MSENLVVMFSYMHGESFLEPIVSWSSGIIPELIHIDSKETSHIELEANANRCKEVERGANT